MSSQSICAFVYTSLHLRCSRVILELLLWLRVELCAWARMAKGYGVRSSSQGGLYGTENQTPFIHTDRRYYA